MGAFSASSQGAGEATDLGGIQPWVYVMVYSAFVGQGVALAIAFACHLRSAVGAPVGQGHGRGSRWADGYWVVAAAGSPRRPRGGGRRTGGPGGPRVRVLGGRRVVRGLGGAARPAVGVARGRGCGRCRGRCGPARPCPPVGAPDTVLGTGGADLGRVRRPGRLRRAHARVLPHARARRFRCRLGSDGHGHRHKGGHRPIGRCCRELSQLRPPPRRTALSVGVQNVQKAGRRICRPRRSGNEQRNASASEPTWGDRPCDVGVVERPPQSSAQASSRARGSCWASTHVCHYRRVALPQPCVWMTTISRGSTVMQERS